MRQLVLVLLKMSEYAKIFKVKDKNKKLMAFCINYEKLLEKYAIIWTKIEDLKNMELNALEVYDDRYIKSKIRTFGDKVYTNFCSLDVQEDDMEYKSFRLISIDFLLLYESKYYIQVYLDKYASEIADKRMVDY